jgi:transcriptional regulator with GAF, ATPase, and Fis domain
VSLALAHERLAEEARRTAQAQERTAQLASRVDSLVHELERFSAHRALGRSPQWKRVLADAARVAATETTVLITGESGTGKEVVARYIHRGSPRTQGPFVALNCAALPEQLMESELFGHEKGAFTGALNARPGRIEQAGGGVLFLDEVGEMSPSVQAKFLRVLQEREYQRLGGARTLKADVRVLAASNRNLRAAIAQGSFREDLYYRLAVFDIALPPLRERQEDIQLLAEHFLAKFSEQMDKRLTSISHEALQLMLRYDWPGNIRELENTIERAVALEHTPVILPDSLSPGVRGDGPRASTAGVPQIPGDPLPESGFDLEAHVKEIERGYIAEALKRAGGVQVKAAELLGMSFRSFRYYVKKYNLR